MKHNFPRLFRGNGRTPGWRLLAVLFIAELLRASSCQTQELSGDSLVRAVLKGWEKRRGYPTTVTYKLTGSRTWHHESFETLLESAIHAQFKAPTWDVTGKFNRDLTLDLAGNRFRLEFDNVEYETGKRKAYRIKCLEVGDSSTLRVLIKTNEGNAGLGRKSVVFWIVRGDSSLIPPSILETGYQPLFFAHGIVPAKDVRVRPTALVAPIDSAAFSFVRMEKSDENVYAILQEGPKKYWVDLNHDAAIVKMVIEQSAEVPLTEIKIKYRQVSNFWLPNSWHETFYRNGRASVSEYVEVTQILIDPILSEQTFKLEPTAGMYVKEEKYFRDPKTGSLTSSSQFYTLDKDSKKIPVEASKSKE